MTSANFLKTAFLSAVIATSALSAPTASANPYLKERDTEGFFKEPICNYDFYIKRSLFRFLNEKPTGITSQNQKWDMEIYADEAGGSWTLVGKSKDPKANPRFWCEIAKGMSTTPYAQQVWYQNYFGKDTSQ